ncbi:hypothetical protein GCM10010191_53150 [Actinomadura vinacea]|uniref:PPM-type phosphatase domain-containing protein n=1 Tax=Actinomadura vinacea TaxID=115336 RepID=A0ABN3JJP4_9ACTN
MIRRRDRPAEPTYQGMEFPRPNGRGTRAARMPWRLPDEPALSGIAADAVSVGGLTVRAASMVGPGHRCEEPAQPRQDAYRLGRDTAKRYLLVAVADGMSDSKRSHVGANVAVTALVGRLRADLGKGVPLDAPGIFLDASRQMAGAAHGQGLAEDDVRAAALAAVVPVEPDAAGGRDVWLAWLADVGAWHRTGASGGPGWRRIGGAEKGGLDAGRLSEFLPFHPGKARHAVVRVERGAVLAFATDGIGDALTGRTAEWFARRWDEPPHVAAFVQDVGYEARGLLDDRTAVVLWCDR